VEGPVGARRLDAVMGPAGPVIRGPDAGPTLIAMSGMVSGSCKGAADHSLPQVSLLGLHQVR
jgi:hypothetical protein